MLTLSYARTETKLFLCFLCIFSLAILGITIESAAFHNLPNNVNITFVDDDFPSWQATNYLINYFHQTSVTFLTTYHYFFDYFLTLVVMNHLLWLLDSLILKVAKLDVAGDDEVEVKAKFTEIIEQQYSALEWLSSVQSLMQLNFFFEFALLSVVICLCFCRHLLSSSYLFLAVTGTLLTELFIYCFMGTCVMTRFEIFSAALYKLDWLSLDVGQRKDLLKILTSPQNTKGFKGVFWKVDMQTFKRVIEKNVH